MSKPLNPLNTWFLLGTLVASIVLVPLHLYLNGFEWSEWIACFIMVFLIGTAIRAGYHRLFAHRAYRASAPIRFLWLVMGAASFENSALKWSCDHRIHHQFSEDPDRDPYPISKGFWHAHWLWVMESSNKPLVGVTDLEKDSMVMWQHRNHFLIGGAFSTLPLWYGIATGHFWGYLIIGVLLRIVLTHHTTFLINSMAHWYGTKTYSNRESAKDNFLLAPLTYGEGFHNFHHTWQWDYRNGARWYQWDSTKWILKTLSWTSLVNGLRTVSLAEMQKAKVLAQEERLAVKLSHAKPDLRQPLQGRLSNAKERLVACLSAMEQCRQKYKDVKAQYKKDPRSFAQIKAEWSLKVAQEKRVLRDAWRQWREVQKQIQMNLSQPIV